MAANRGKPRKEPKAAPNPASWRGAGVALKVVLALGLVAAAVAGVAWVGDRAGDRVAGRDRYAVRVADLACDAPPGTDRATFLTEVRYLAGLPETVQAVDPGLSGTLTAAFARHPWVAEVPAVAVEADGRVRVDLRFRVPVLAVRVEGEPGPRVVDRAGVLLPPTAKADGLPVLANPVLPPTKPAGQAWDDPTVKRAAELVELFREKRPARVEHTARGWRVTLGDGQGLVIGS